MDGLISALAAAAREAREEQGVSQEEIAVALGASKDKVRYFENARGHASLERTLAAYYSTTGITPLELLAKVEAILKRQAAPARVTQAAKDLGEATRQAQKQGSGKPQPKETSREAG